MKIIALYLPQYHEISENNEWWGKGYTEWVAVKKAKKYCKKQEQPRVPLNHNYYDLVKNGKNVWQWQSDLMNRYHIDGLCIYHYWFEGKQLLQKPMQILLNNPDIKINYSICWANESWSRNWDGRFNEILMYQTYGGEEDWEKHFNYLLPFFKDKRYLKMENKPIVHLYHSYEIPQLAEMQRKWNDMACDNGFNGIYWVSAITAKGIDIRNHLFDHYYYFEPGYTQRMDMQGSARVFFYFVGGLRQILNKFFKEKCVAKLVNAEYIWEKIENRKPKPQISPGTYVGWDNTPRRGINGTVYYNATPQRFRKHMELMKNKYSNNEYLYINAWNEWGEGAYLEPDEKNQYKYLEAIRGT